MSLDAAVWSLALLFSMFTVVFYSHRFRKRVVSDTVRLDEAKRLGFDRATGQYPYIDPRLCLGCGTCVEACPEGDVLGLVGGQAVVVNGVRCIGVAHCAQACPVDAITVGLGDVRNRTDIPVLDDWNETVVPGLFVAGELSGLSLVRNAIEQGKRTVQRAREKLRGAGRGDASVLDILVVGSGPAGLSAALSAKDLGLSCRVVEQEKSLGGTILHYPRRKLVHTQPVDLPLYGRITKEEQTKEELLELFSGLATRHRLDIAFGHRVKGVERVNGHFEVSSAATTFKARLVVLAIGRRGTPRKLGVEGEEQPKVMYQVRDAEQYRNQRILCVGGGDSAVEAAMGLAQQPGNQVHLSYRKSHFARIKRRNQERLEKAVAEGRLKPIMNSNVVKIDKQEVRLAVDGREQNVGNDFVFILAGGEPPYPFLKSIGVRFGGEESSGAGGARA